MHSPQPSASARQSLGQRIAAVAATRPDQPAIIAADVRERKREVLTWYELELRTRHVARHLRRVLHEMDTRPTLWVAAGNQVGSIVSLLGGMRAGCVVASLDASAPAADIERSVAAVERSHGPVSSLDDLLAQTTDLDLPDPHDDDDPASGSWILMTGGSTGVPQPIAGHGTSTWDSRHGPKLLLQRTGWRTGQVQLVVGPLHHAAPFASFLDGILSGNTLVIANAYYPELLFDLAAEHQVEWMQLTPVHMRMADPLLSSRVDQLRSLRAVLHTAAPCPPDTKRKWISALGSDRVFEMYAATESIGTTLCTGEEWLQRPGTVGRGFLTRIRVLDDQRCDLPAGEVGEVFMRSLQHSRSPRRYDGLRGFRSVGDHGWVDGDGYLYLSGRSDDLVIIGGENVYLGEVESALLVHEDVADVAVVAVDDHVLHASLHAYVVARPGATLDERALRGHFRRQLPAAKRPRNVHIVDELPRNAAGKLMRRKVGSWPTP